MHWSDFLKLLGSAGGLTVLVQIILSYKLNARMEKWKQEHEDRLEYLRAALVRVDHLETDLIQSRGKAYGEIWSLTATMAVFAAVNPISAADLSSKFSDWWYTQGWLLTEESRSRCFLIQEVLHFYILRSMSFRRPAEEQLFGTAAHTVEVLRQLRKEQLGIEPKEDEGRYSVKELRDCVAAWKSKRINAPLDSTTPEQAWVLLQFLMSAFRNKLVEELRPPKARTPSAAP